MSTEVLPVARLETKSTDLVTRALSIEITSHVSYEFAAGVGKEISQLKKAVKQYWDDKSSGPVALAYRAWKGTVAKRDEMLHPLDQAGRSVANQIMTYEAEMQRIAREKQRKIDEEAQKARDLEIRRAAAAAKKEGADKDDVKVLRQQMRDEPIITPTVVPPPAPKGISTAKPWMARLTGDTETEQRRSLAQLVTAIAKGAAPWTFVKVDQVAINQWAKSTKGTDSIPGLTAYQSGHLRFR